MQDYNQKLNTWEPEIYNKCASFVYENAGEVLNLLDPQKEDVILDIGCGEGSLTKQIHEKCKKIIGIDSSKEMIDSAQKKGLEVYQLNALDINYENTFDKIFSNAVLHWIQDHDLLIKKIYKALKPNGLFACEFGGITNIASVHTALNIVAEKMNLLDILNNIQWNFTSEKKFQYILENNNFKVLEIGLYPRLTKFKTNIADWISIFRKDFLENIKEKELFLEEITRILKPILYDPFEDCWYIDYARLRVKAVKL